MPHFTRLQATLIWSLLDFAVAVASTCLRRATAWRDRPVLRVERSSAKRVRPTRERRSETRVVAVLVSRAGMAERLRRALGGRARMCFTSTWDELQHVVARLSPSAVFADPVADKAGDPERHLARLSRDWGVSVILYTTLTSASAGSLLRLGRWGIRHVIFHGCGDSARRLAAMCECGPREPPPPPLRAA